MATAEEVRIRLTAQDDTKTAFNSVQRNMDSTSKASATMNRQIGASRNVMGQLGFQIQDVAVQLGAGQNAMLVLGQQGSQIASIFGPSGAVVGAFIAVASAIGGALVSSLFQARKSLADLKGEMMGFIGSMEGMNESQLRLAQNVIRVQQVQARNIFSAASPQRQELARLKLKTDRTQEETAAMYDLELQISKAEMEYVSLGEKGLEAAERLKAARKGIDYKSEEDKAKELLQLQHDMLDEEVALGRVRAKEAKSVQQEMERLAKMEEQSITQMKNTISDALTASIVDFKSFRDVVTNVSNAIARSLIKQQIADPFAQAASSFFGKLEFGDMFSFNGGGFTGAGSRTGGVDGRGGFPAILHPNETVIDHTKGGGAGSVINVTYSPQVNALDPRTAQTVIASNAPTIVGIIEQAMNRRGRTAFA